MPGLTTGYTGSQLFGASWIGDALLDTPPGLPMNGEWFAYRMPVGDNHNSLTVSVNPMAFAVNTDIWITSVSGTVLAGGVREVTSPATPGELYFVCAAPLQFGKSVLNFVPGYLDTVPDVRLNGVYLTCPLSFASIWFRRLSSEDKWIRYSGCRLSDACFPLATFATSVGFLASRRSGYLRPGNLSGGTYLSPQII